MQRKLELPAEKLRTSYDPQSLTCQTSMNAEPAETIIGQERAVRSLQFGLGIPSFGFNIYVAGPPGTGRTTAAKRFLEQVASEKPVPNDWCYVNNFQDPYRPKALSLPPGQGVEFQADVKHLVEETQEEIYGAFESDEYVARREDLGRTFQQQRDELFSSINEKAQQEGFVLRSTRIGLLTIPLKDGKPLNDEEFMTLNVDEQQEITQRRERLQNELKTFVRQARVLEKSLQEHLEELDQEVALFTLSPLINDLKEKYQNVAAAVAHLEEMQADILENLFLFREESPEQSESPIPQLGKRASLFRRYEVNVLVNNAALSGAPVIIEPNPTHNHLFGRIEKEAQFGALVTDFTLIREGCLHRANGGYLVLPAEDILRDPLAWDTLKRSLRNEQINIEEAGERLGFISTKSLRPEPIPLDVKVILIGHPSLYHLLYSRDEDFRELFKVKADFDTTMERTQESVDEYVSLVCSLCETEALRHLDSSALARIVEHGSRLAQDQDKLSTRFGDLSDVVREASYYAQQEDSEYVTAEHVKRAIDEKFYRSSLLQEKIAEMIQRGTVMIDVSGEQVGQVNGLSVIGLGDLAFGRPNRITASVGLGRQGLIDIEREAKLAGPIHTKGVLILSGYLAEKFSQDKPLSLSARLVFEQSYSGVEGDSASSAELYALLSTLSGLPIKQGIAVTGSVNQKGQVQAIGGVNEKIEGFFEICQAKGLTGEQGVLIPESNVKNLMLKEEIVEAVAAGQFHVWAVHTVDEGIAVLTGVEAGQRGEDGAFEEGSVNDLVDKRLRELAEVLSKFGKPEKKAEVSPAEEETTAEAEEQEGE